MSAITALLDRDDVAEAFIKSLEAETANNYAQAEYHDAESKFKMLEVAGGELDLERATDVRKRERTNDYYLRVYPFTESVNPLSARACIERLNVWERLDPKAPIEVIFTSPGGDIISGLALYDHIKSLAAPTTTVALGMAASMAGILLQAGDKRVMGRESWLMIHEISFGAGGKIGEVEDITEWLKAVQSRVQRIFVDRSDGKLSDRKFTTNWKRKDWFISSDEALKLGLVDEIR